MSINSLATKALFWLQNTKTARFFANSLIFENIDTISFYLLIATIVSTAFAGSGIIGALALGFTLSCLFKVLFKPNAAFKVSFLNKILIVYLLIVAISLMGATYFALSLKGILKTLIYAGFYFAAVYYLNSNRGKIFPVILTVAGVTSIEAVIGILQNFAHVEEISGWQDTSNLADPTHAISRAYGTLKPYNPNLLAGYLVAGLSSIFAMFSVSYVKKNKTRAIVFGILFLITIFAIYATGCRGAYLGLLGFLAVIFSYFCYRVKKYYGGFRKIKTRYKAMFFAAVLLCMGALFLVPSFFERILSIFSFRKDSSISFRMNVYEACYQMFLDNKFLGVGVGNKNFREIYGLYMKTGYDALGSYCVPLEIAVESGVFALLSFALFIGIVVFKCVKYLLKNGVNPISKILFLSVLLTVTGVMCHGLFDTIFFRPQVQIIFWVNIAIFNSVLNKCEKMENFHIIK